LCASFNFLLYLPDEAAPQQLNIPHKQLKAYFQDLDEDFYVALVNLPTTSEPYFLSVNSIPEEMLAIYNHAISTVLLNFALINE
jgi:hypothetical protein